MNELEVLLEENKKLLKLVEQYRITEKHVIDNLKSENSIIVQVLDRMPFVAFINTRDYCVWVNSCCEKMMGYTREEWINQTPEEFIAKFHPDDLSKFFYIDFDYFKSHMDPNDMFLDSEYRMLNKAGEWRWVYSTCTPLEFDDKGNLLLTLGTAIDITDRINAESEVKRLNIELKAAYQRERILSDKQNELLRAENDTQKLALKHVSKIIATRNSEISEIIKELEKYGIDSGSLSTELNSIKSKLLSMIEQNNSWNILESQFIRIYPNFYKTLSAKYPNLSPLETNLCLLLKLQIPLKEISNILSINTRGIENLRLGIKNKLNISVGESLVSMLENII